jgi:hypothetical protein
VGVGITASARRPVALAAVPGFPLAGRRPIRRAAFLDMAAAPPSPVHAPLVVPREYGQQPRPTGAGRNAGSSTAGNAR